MHYPCKAWGEGGGRAWHKDLTVFVGPGVECLTNVLLGVGYLNLSFFTDVVCGDIDHWLRLVETDHMCSTSRMCRTVWKSHCTLSKSEILRLYSIVHVAKETTKMSNFSCESISVINIFSTCQVSACELQPFSCHNLANDIRYSETATAVLSHLNTVSSVIGCG